MSWNNRVVWSEGQFLLPQMFQQQERYLEHVIHYRSLPLSPFFWGFSKYEIDSEALNIGKLVLTEAAGVFADGTPVSGWIQRGAGCLGWLHAAVCHSLDPFCARHLQLWRLRLAGRVAWLKSGGCGRGRSSSMGHGA